jgi:3'-phosphoadenosine 5'-phosphosulfate sulfotransferase (PAPS reductase)/FAD synthetase
MGVSRRLKDRENPEWLAIKWTTPNSMERLANILNERMVNKKGGANQRLAIMLGMLTKDKNNPIKANIPEKDRSQFSMEKYKFFLDAPFEISNKCCNIMKKNPVHKYHKDTGRVPITAQMASESRLRTQKWLQNSCNGFNLRIPTSNAMAFWTEQDVLLYIKSHNLEICSVYGDVVSDDEEWGQIDMAQWTGMEIFELGNKPLHCTGVSRTGCVACGFGCHISGDERFLKLKESHPNMYKILDVAKNSGYTMREAIEWCNDHGNLNIKL